MYRIYLTELVRHEVEGLANFCGCVSNEDRTAKVICDNTGIYYCRTISSNNSFDEQSKYYETNREFLSPIILTKECMA